MPNEKQKRKTGQHSSIPPRWQKAIIKRQSDQEKLRKSVLQKINLALKTIEKKYDWKEAYLFGSVTKKETFRRNSDIDLAVSGLNKLDHYAFLAELSDLLEKSVDVVLLEECPFAESIKEKGLKWNRKTGF